MVLCAVTEGPERLAEGKTPCYGVQQEKMFRDGCVWDRCLWLVHFDDNFHFHRRIAGQ